jgi:predicted nucleotidyltransferase
MMLDKEKELVQQGAAFLYTKGARRVWLFGARASNHTADARSDLDYAVEGIPPQRLYVMAKELGHATGVEVDLVDMRTAPPRLRPHILRTRVLLPRLLR